MGVHHTCRRHQRLCQQLGSGLQQEKSSRRKIGAGRGPEEDLHKETNHEKIVFEETVAKEIGVPNEIAPALLRGLKL